MIKRTKFNFVGGKQKNNAPGGISVTPIDFTSALSLHLKYLNLNCSLFSFLFSFLKHDISANKIITKRSVNN